MRVAKSIPANGERQTSPYFPTPMRVLKIIPASTAGEKIFFKSFGLFCKLVYICTKKTLKTLVTMDQNIEQLPAKAKLQRRALHTLLTCAIVLIVNYLATPGLNWGLWATLGLVAALLYDVIDYVVVKRNTKEE